MGEKAKDQAEDQAEVSMILIFQFTLSKKQEMLRCDCDVSKECCKNCILLKNNIPSLYRLFRNMQLKQFKLSKKQLWCFFDCNKQDKGYEEKENEEREYEEDEKEENADDGKNEEHENNN